MQATLVYLAAPPEMRSRIYGVLSVCIGVGMIGFIHLGLLAGLIGAPWATATIGVEGSCGDAADPALVARGRARDGAREDGVARKSSLCHAALDVSLRRYLPGERKCRRPRWGLRRAETRGVDYVERARALAPMLTAAADEIEEQRQLAGTGRRGADRGRLFPLAVAALAGRRRTRTR